MNLFRRPASSYLDETCFPPPLPGVARLHTKSELLEDGQAAVSGQPATSFFPGPREPGENRVVQLRALFGKVLLIPVQDRESRQHHRIARQSTDLRRTGHGFFELRSVSRRLRGPGPVQRLAPPIEECPDCLLVEGLDRNVREAGQHHVARVRHDQLAGRIHRCHLLDDTGGVLPRDAVGRFIETVDQDDAAGTLQLVLEEFLPEAPSIVARRLCEKPGQPGRRMASGRLRRAALVLALGDVSRKVFSANQDGEERTIETAERSRRLRVDAEERPAETLNRFPKEGRFAAPRIAKDDKRAMSEQVLERDRAAHLRRRGFRLLTALPLRSSSGVISGRRGFQRHEKVVDGEAVRRSLASRKAADVDVGGAVEQVLQVRKGIRLRRDGANRRRCARSPEGRQQQPQVGVDFLRERVDGPVDFRVRADDPARLQLFLELQNPGVLLGVA